ncbi:DNA polymerase III subunit chi [Lampropedia puyangensis]|uniref:DNA polymerase III subunit chi n=1 Tax=Lampropedia puyangensis TaxID=1330072 RepID=A0A4S8EXS0_9BURK|nr:DNA polymerase III subunit chi [Lampropedia puyangensis]THT99689.1 DNA polymerase III subunit chi [Lampropedia puyangensis]
MTDVHFYFNVPDKLNLACRLARKAFMQESGMVLTGNAAVLAQLDDMLWQMTASDFVAHDLETSTASPTLVAPVQLREAISAESLAQQEGVFKPTLLLSLWDEVPAAFSHFEHVYELVSAQDGADRERARMRWRYYQQRGYAIHRHDLAQRNA